MVALVTGATSGIGLECARKLARDCHGARIFLVARNEVKLRRTAQELQNMGARAEFIQADLSDEEDVWRVYKKTRDFHVMFLVNAAGAGAYGPFLQTDPERDMELIRLNVSSLHLLTKLFLRDMVERDEGIILNIASSAGFMAGPYFSGYYASKNYVVRLTEAIHEELRRSHSQVRITALCPGPVATDFDKNAGVKKSMRGLSPAYVAAYGIRAAQKGRMLAVPGFSMRLSLILSKPLPDGLMVRMTGSIQRRKAGR